MKCLQSRAFGYTSSLSFATAYTLLKTPELATNWVKDFSVDIISHLVSHKAFHRFWHRFWDANRLRIDQKHRISRISVSPPEVQLAQNWFYWRRNSLRIGFRISFRISARPKPVFHNYIIYLSTSSPTTHRSTNKLLQALAPKPPRVPTQNKKEIETNNIPDSGDSPRACRALLMRQTAGHEARCGRISTVKVEQNLWVNQT